MADYYYAELFFNPERTPFADVVEGCVHALMGAGSQFREIVVPRHRFETKIKWGEFTTAGLDGLRPMCEAALREGTGQGMKLISFPPGWGRVMFEYRFTFDQSLEDEIWDEEEETNALSTDLGASFTYSRTDSQDSYIKLTLSIWEDFVLKHGAPATHMANLNSVFGLWEAIAETKGLSPYFGVMNSELHINADRSLELLEEGRLPEGNEYVLIGRQSIGLLNIKELKESGRRFRALGDGSLLIEFTDRWAPGSAL